MLIRDKSLKCENKFGGCRCCEFELEEDGFFCTECGSPVTSPRMATKIAKEIVTEEMNRIR